jgi:hypothetical protein
MRGRTAAAMRVARVGQGSFRFEKHQHRSMAWRVRDGVFTIPFFG